MKIKLSPTLYAECEPAIEDALARKKGDRPDPTDPVYLKLHAANVGKSGVVVDVEPDELKELRSRFSFLVETALENMEWETDRPFWLGRLNAARAFLRRTKEFV